MLNNKPDDDAKQIFKLNVSYKSTQILGRFRFQLKKFKACLGLFDKNNPVEIHFYPNFIRFAAAEKDKKSINIILACLADLWLKNFFYKVLSPSIYKLTFKKKAIKKNKKNTYG